ncbi:origin recognition complex subunit 6-like [Mizuhopecten yessoensis]|uniref:Origin recognition complex subunit 6 n=1 Tax=Mizuhopecten yessoensis TaxID=6573 RepID=A0A210QH20_MIZYE|nr:origin recognition complex subunit 6-like [Mizuhopecten yessoensis]OWF48060.1 Origin recognition complex subunit 6 [Mizuhopecten yessoensis]
MSKQPINVMSSKLGISSLRTIEKAKELQQLMDVRVGSGSLAALGITGSCPLIMCLDLAASATGQTLTKTEAIRLSGVNKKVYANGLRALESMLELEVKQTIKDLAVQFGCSGAVTLAEQALQRYEQSHNSKSCTQMDFSAPMFQASALYAACRKLKTKVDRKKIVEVCSIKRTTFDRLVADLEKQVETIIGEQGKVKSTAIKKRPKSLMDDVERHMQEEESKRAKTDNSEESGGNVDYKDWKKRILEKALKAKKEAKAEKDTSNTADS